MKIKILIPVYNDWQSLNKLLENINNIVSNNENQFSVIIVNDASTENIIKIDTNFENLNSIKIINMKENKGHARCNAAGLKYIYEKEEFDYVIPMDGDGEDRPEEILELVDNLKYNPDKPIVGERTKRSEGFLFRFCYLIHKLITHTFTGENIKFGNYTCLPKLIIEKMISDKATWCSFSGSLAKVAKERAAISSERGKRYFGPSKMSFKNLILHSLSIISVFKIGVIIRSIIFLLIYFFLIHQKISFITLTPIYLVVLMNILTYFISKRENILELNNSLENIRNIDIIK